MDAHANTTRWEIGSGPGPGSGRLRMIRTRRGLKWRDSEAALQCQCREAVAAAKRRAWEGREPVTRQNSV
jgi:hypothetical protein